ncbi:BQ2448_83 [Microbotryum intermedium]|uniref:BQ2448_83 protein n=1 Tax=Microbotryum intermedium TaxID=269621 RepID=A0A238F1G7_9BASI|nr:BQ2448_83 [Microbotryum intermedium]
MVDNENPPTRSAVKRSAPRTTTTTTASSPIRIHELEPQVPSLPRRKIVVAVPPLARNRVVALEPPSHFLVSVGSYERLLYGLSCHLVRSDSNDAAALELSIEPCFSFPAHLSSIRALGSSLLPSPETGTERKVGGKWLVSGGTDEMIKVWDLKRRKQVGTLESGQMRGMLICATTDSTIALYRVRDWVLLRCLKGHQGRVNSIDPHPASRVALSVGQDKMLRMWDLVAGKAVATMKIGMEGDVVKWNTDGTKFAIICNNRLTVYGIDMNVLHTLVAPHRFQDVQFTYFPLDKSTSQKEYMFVAGDDKMTQVYDVSQPSVVKPNEEGEDVVDAMDLQSSTLDVLVVLKGHMNRVKRIELLEIALPPAKKSHPSTLTSTSTSTMLIITISSDGQILFFDLAQIVAHKGSEHEEERGIQEVEALGRWDTKGSRLTCLSVVGVVEKKKEGKEEEEVDEGEEGSSESESEEGEEQDNDKGLGSSGEEGSQSGQEDEEEEAEEGEEEWDGIEEEDEDEEEEDE